MRKASITALALSVFIAIFFVGIYIWDNTKVVKIGDEDVVVSSDNNIVTNIEKVDSGEKSIVIQGWAIEKDKMYDFTNWISGPGKSVYNNNEVVLKDEEGNLLKINTVSKIRPDVNEQMGNKINYKSCGVQASVKKSKLEKNKIYKIGIIITTLEGTKILSMSDKEISI